MLFLILVQLSVSPELAPFQPLWNSAVTEPCLSGNYSVLQLQQLIEPLSMNTDDFEGVSLDPAWNISNPGNYLREISSGALILTPTTYTQWFNGEASGAQLWKQVRGNVKITARIRARSAANPNDPVSGAPFQLGGLMMRDPLNPPHNYLFVAVGMSNGSLQTETKNTVNSNSVWDPSPWGTGDAELRLCRVGTRFLMYARPITGGTWQFANPDMPFLDRTDLPDTLIVGPIAYGPTNSPNLEAHFEEISFQPVWNECGCTED